MTVICIGKAVGNGTAVKAGRELPRLGVDIVDVADIAVINFLNAVGCSSSCGLLASRTGVGEERFDFAEFLAQPRLSGIFSGHGAWAPSYRRQWRQVVIAIPARRMQQDRLQAGHTTPPSRSVRQVSERPPCCRKESAMAYPLQIWAEREPVERRQRYVSETSSSALSIEAQLIS